MTHSSTPTEIEIPIPGMTLKALAWGPPSGRPLLAVHGWLDNAASFIPLAPLLGDYRIVAVDLPGHGQSPWRDAGATYHFVDWVPVIFEVADALGWERFTYVGHSMGAAIGSLAAGTFPERIASLTMIEGLGPLVYEDHEVPERLGAFILQRRRLIRKEPHPHPSREAAAKRLSRVVSMLSVESARMLVDRGTKEVAGGFTWRTDPRLRRISPIRFTEGQVEAFVARIAAPSLVILAEDGWPLPVEIMESRLAKFSRVEVARLAGGHHIHMELASTVADVIADFLNGLA